MEGGSYELNTKAELDLCDPSRTRKYGEVVTDPNQEKKGSSLTRGVWPEPALMKRILTEVG